MPTKKWMVSPPCVMGSNTSECELDDFVDEGSENVVQLLLRDGACCLSHHYHRSSSSLSTGISCVSALILCVASTEM